MSTAVKLENRSSYVGETSVPHSENQLVALCMIYSLLNETLGEGVMVQGETASSLSKGQDKVRVALDSLNNNMSALQEVIQGLKEEIDRVGPWVMGLSIASVAFAVVAGGIMPAAAMLRVGMEAFTEKVIQYAGVAQVAARAVSGLAAVAGGIAGTIEGSWKLKQAGASHDLAPVNAGISLGNATQRNYQATSKKVTDDIGECMSRLASIAQSIAKDVRTINEGLREANRDVLQGVLGSYR